MKNAFGTERLVALLKCLIAAYLITGVLLLAVAGVLYKFSIGENIVDVSIIVFLLCWQDFFSPKGRRIIDLSGECWQGRHTF